MTTCMYENEVQIQSSISVAFVATYNHFQTELAVFFYDILVKKSETKDQAYQ